MSETTTMFVVCGSLIAVLFTGVPIVFGLAGLSALLMTILLGPNMLYVIVAAVANQLTVDVFLAIPMFVLMAVLLQNSGAAADLYQTMYVWMGGLRGGLASGTVVISALIAAMSGVGGTATITMGLIALPELLKRKYNRMMTIGCITSGGTLGPIIPPSILMIIVGGYTQVSVGKLFLAGVIPGLIIAGGFIAYITIRCFINVEDGPPISASERGDMRSRIKSLRNVIMPVMLVVAVMGFIYAGIGTPTEAAGIGAFGAFFIGVVNRKLSVALIYDAAKSTTRVTSMVMWLVFGGASYSALVNISGIGNLLSNALVHIPFGAFGLMAVMIIVCLILGMFIDPVAICMISLPIFFPAIVAAGIDPLWSMLIFTISLVIGYITPPFGMNLFFMAGIAPKDVTMNEIYRSVLPYVAIMCICLLFFTIFPKIVTVLPDMALAR